MHYITDGSGCKYIRDPSRAGINFNRYLICAAVHTHL